MTGNNLLLGIKERAGLAVTIKNEFLVEQVVPPLFERLNYGVKFLVIGRILLPNVVQFLTEIGDNVALLTKHTTDAYARGITCDLEDV